MSDYIAGIRFRSDSREIRKSEKDLRGLEKQTRRTEKAAATMGKVFGRALAGLSVGLVFRQVIKNTIEQERVTAQLNATLKSTGRFSEETSRALREQAKAYQDLTKFGDEAVIGAQNILLTFRRINGEAFTRATEATLDLATAMGTDLKSAALQVGKALEDPATQMTYLSRAGITFTQQQKDMVRALQDAGDLAGAQAIVLKELETQFGGSARAARNTFGGALEAVKNAFGDLLEADGDNLTGAIGALNELEKLLQSEEVKKGFDTIAEGAVNLLSTLAQLPGAFGYVKDEIRELFGIIDSDDIPRLEDELVRLQEELGKSYALEGNNATAFVSSLLGNTDDTRAEIRARMAQIEAQLAAARAALVNKAEEDALVTPALPDAPPGATFTISPQLDSDAVFDIEGLDAWIDDVERGDAASLALRENLNQLAADMGGPVVAAGLRLAETMQTLDEYERTLIDTGKLNAETQAQLASARALATQQYEAEVEAIQSQLSPAQQLIADLEREIELIGLSNAEREKRIALQLAGADATDEEIAAIGRLIETKARQEEAEAAVNALRSSAEGALADFLSGAKSAEDAFSSFADNLRQQAAQLLAEKAISMILSSFGGGAAGTGGGLFGTFFEGMFGPGRALGGPVYPGRLHPVVERGEPELLTIGRQQYLMTGSQQGKVEPVSSVTNNRRTNITVNLPPETRRRTAQQTAYQVSRVQKRADSRNR